MQATYTENTSEREPSRLTFMALSTPTWQSKFQVPENDDGMSDDFGMFRCILDGEMLVWDPLLEKYLAFGSLKSAALGESR